MLGLKGAPMDELRELVVGSVELQLGRDMTLAPVWGEGIDIGTDEGIEKLHSVLYKTTVCALLMANDFGSDDPGVEVEWLVKAAEAATKLKCKAIRIDMNLRSQEMDLSEFPRRCISVMNEVLRQTESMDVEFGVENHGMVSNNTDFLNEVFGGVGSDRLGLTLDTGNFYWYGTPLKDVYRNIRIFAPAVKHTHIKTICYPEEMREKKREIGWEYGKYASPLHEGDLDFNRIARILKEAGGYDGAFCIEDESLSHYSTNEEKFRVLLKDVAHLRSCLDNV